MFVCVCMCVCVCAFSASNTGTMDAVMCWLRVWKLTGRLVVVRRGGPREKSKCICVKGNHSNQDVRYQSSKFSACVQQIMNAVPHHLNSVQGFATFSFGPLGLVGGFGTPQCVPAIPRALHKLRPVDPWKEVLLEMKEKPRRLALDE